MDQFNAWDDNAIGRSEMSFAESFAESQSLAFRRNDSVVLFFKTMMRKCYLFRK